MNSSAAECKIRNSPSKPPIPTCRKAIRSEGTEENFLNNNLQSSHMEGKRSGLRNTSKNLSKTEDSFKNQSTNHDTQMTESSSEEDEAQFLDHSQNHSRTFSSENYISKPKQDLGIKQNTGSSFSVTTLSIIVIIGFVLLAISVVLARSKNEVQTQPINVTTKLLSNSIKSIKTKFHNQESDIWNDISSAINEVTTRTPKIPSIVLLFAKETSTMDCLAAELARASSTILHTDDYLVFNPKDFGNDAGEIITKLNEYSPEEKRVVMVRDILNINTEAIKALHNLCDRINPLVAEAIFILTMQTNNYQSQQKKLKFVENQIYNKLSKSIDRDVLMALVTRVTDGAIISVQPEPQLKYC